MLPFDFQPRTRVTFGDGTIARAGELARHLNFRKSLIVADPGVVRCGHAKRLEAILGAAGIDTLLTTEFGVNPDSEMVARGCDFASRLAIDSIVAIGGGSALDYAKGVNFLVTNGGAMADYRGYAKALKPLLPMIGIPTTSGTGSEAQSYAVISDAATRLKMACGDPTAAFRIAVLDPELTLTAPWSVSAAAGYDALAHAVETSVTKRRNPVSDVFCERAWTLLANAFPKVLADGNDREARASMMLGAHFAGAAIEQSMLGAAHACANPLTAHVGLSHGHALAIVLPHVVRWNGPVAEDRYRDLLVLSGRPADDPSERLAQLLEEFASVAHLPRKLSAAGVDSDAIPELAQLAAQQWTGTFNPRAFDAAGAEEIYRAAM